MGSWRLRGAVVAALAASALGAAPVHGADPPSQPVTPITIGDGYKPAVTVDDAGTAHIAWLGNEFDPNTLHYCRLPRGAAACAVTTQIAADGNSGSRPFVVVDGNIVQVVNYRYHLTAHTDFAGDFVFTSTDGGATFAPGVEAGSTPISEAALGPGNAVSTMTQDETGGMFFQRVPLDGGSAGTARALLSSDYYDFGSVGLLDPNTPLAVMTTPGSDAGFRRYTGNGDPNDAANWSPLQSFGYARSPQVAAGPSGLFVIAGAGDRSMESVHFNGTTFDPAVKIPNSSGETPFGHGIQDGSGRLHVVEPQITAKGSRLLYATSDDGRAWAERQLAFEPLAGEPRISAAPDHRGFAVWFATDSAGTKRIMAAPIGPTAAVPTAGKFAAADLVSGAVSIKVPGSSRFIQLRGGDVIPVGSIVDTTGGRVRITIALPGGKLQSSDFFEGFFKLTQARSGLATMVLTGGSTLGTCVRLRTHGGPRASKVKVIRHLWGSGSGKFRTKGRFASATVRGTTWDTIDRCDGTLIKVTKGKVAVTDLKRHKTVVIKKGQSYLAKA